MTSVLSEEETKIAKLKQKLMNDVRGKEEARSFLSFSRENLSISQSDLEHGLNRQRFRPDRNTVLSIVALTIALLCLGLETWKLRCSLINAREIEELKRDVESLKHRFLEEDLLDELKAFEEQLYAGESNDDDDSGEADIDNADYDSNYEDTYALQDYSSDYHSPLSYGARPSDFPEYSSTIAPVPSPPEPSTDKAALEMLAATRRTDANDGQESKKNGRSGHRHVDRERHLEEHERKTTEATKEKQKSNTKQKRDVPDGQNAMNLLLEWRTALKRKRSVNEHKDASKRLNVQRHGDRNHTRRMITTGSSPQGDTADKPDGDKQDTSIDTRGRHPPKKYYTVSAQDAGYDFMSVETHRTNGSINGQHQPRKSARRLRKHLTVPRQVFAAHYSADRELPGVSECNHRCGRLCNVTDTGHCHKDRIFTAWRATDWVDQLMSQHFNMQNDGSLVINKDGLYLVYAQIHYVDTVHEAGFNLEVNDRVILKCTVSRSCKKIDQTCFSAQVTLLRQNDSLALKETGESPRGAVLEAIDSFFGVVRLGDVRTLSRRVSSQ
ncbi:PREDICTED: uncharacterized protein LOC107192589 [Dufourea novaeangliae]|uniref:uncharacterized protein LOC107192589 n=1 Tax=Dufourea novaeangliae TaxID=178035 RepID=UPI0007675291|nr:PREDICTED: uncharacterized protein LOC107192589 [Dufourea novaeangliae]